MKRISTLNFTHHRALGLARRGRGFLTDSFMKLGIKGALDGLDDLYTLFFEGGPKLRQNHIETGDEVLICRGRGVFERTLEVIDDLEQVPSDGLPTKFNEV